LWVLGTLFITFFLISALNEYLAGTAFGFLAVTSIAAWDFPANTDVLFGNTLWTALAVAVGAAVTTAVELIFRHLHPSDELSDRLLDRMKTVEDALQCLAEGCPIDEGARRKLEQYAMTGTAALRQLLARSPQSPESIAEMSATVALTGRLVDLTAHVRASTRFPEEERPAFRHAAERLGDIRRALQAKNARAIANMDLRCDNCAAGSFLADVQTTIERFPEVYSGLRSLAEFMPSDVDIHRPKSLFKDDAFTSSNHLQFALKGTLAAGSCYFLYNAIQWRGLSNSVATCMITALSTVGASRQKQLLRVSGAVIGGLGFGMLSQIVLLPYLNGIGEFTLLFAAVTAASAWIGTSSPRVSYAGAQTAFAFYVTHLRVFGPQTSLTVARDDVLGILFGLMMMWVTFDRIWAKDSAADMMDSFVSNIRRIAAFDEAIAAPDIRSSIDRARRERAAINENFNNIRNIGDALIFEFGTGWRRKIQMRDHVRMWQPQLRTYFLLRVALSHYRLQADSAAIGPEARENVKRSEQLLYLLADLQDRKKQDYALELRQTIDTKIKFLQDTLATPPDQTVPQSQPVRLSRQMLEVALSLAEEMRRPETGSLKENASAL
jgi:multidrug resistance protein MdtO